MWKKVFLVIGGIALLVIGVLLGGGHFNRRRGSGTNRPLDDVREHTERAECEAERASDAVDQGAGEIDSSAERIAESQDINRELAAGNTTAERLIRRSREILATATARSNSNSG